MSEHELKEIEIRLSQTQNGPWKAFIEGRDFESGASFIMTGLGDSRNNDIEFIGGNNC
jgi:hypothetical protein